jgi:hypothetical protein
VVVFEKIDAAPSESLLGHPYLFTATKEEARREVLLRYEQAVFRDRAESRLCTDAWPTALDLEADQAEGTGTRTVAGIIDWDRYWAEQDAA